MRFAVATHAMLLLIGVNEDLEVDECRQLNTGYHYGLALENGAGSPTPNLIAYHGGPSVFEENDKQLLYFGGPDFVGPDRSMRLAEPVGSVHQIANANGGLYIANTGQNSVTYVTLDGKVRHDYTVDGVTHDRNHVNSVFPCGSQVYVLLHNLFRKESEFLMLHHDPDSGFTAGSRHSLWHLQAHNIFIDQHQLAYNASSAREFVVANLDEDRMERRFSFTEHTKGLAVTDRYFVLGLSEYASRDERSATKGDLVFIDRTTLGEPRRVSLDLPDLPGPIGNINEIRCVSGEELGHAQPSDLAVAWKGIKLARATPLSYWGRRMNTKLLRMPRRVYKRYQMRARGHTS